MRGFLQIDQPGAYGSKSMPRGEQCLGGYLVHSGDFSQCNHAPDPPRDGNENRPGDSWVRDTSSWIDQKLLEHRRRLGGPRIIAYHGVHPPMMVQYHDLLFRVCPVFIDSVNPVAIRLSETSGDQASVCTPGRTLKRQPGADRGRFRCGCFGWTGWWCELVESCRWQLDCKLGGADGPVYGLAVQTPGDRLITGGWDGKLKQWDMTGQLLEQVQTGSPVTAMVNDPVTGELLTGHADAGIRYWALPAWSC